jgi:hypothetical protein
VDKEREEMRLARPWLKNAAGQTDRPAENDSSRNGSPQNNPDLERARKQSAEFNARVHHALAEIPVPPELRERILARRKIIPVRGWRRHQSALAMAAAFVILGALAVVFWRPSSEDLTFEGFRSRMVAFAVRQYRMDIHTNQLAVVRSHLARQGAPADFGLPPALAARPVIGGASLAWQGKPVGMVCFSATNGQTLYMFVINSADAPGSAEFEASSRKTLGTVTWRAAGKTFLIAGDVPVAELEKLVKS